MEAAPHPIFAQPLVERQSSASRGLSLIDVVSPAPRAQWNETWHRDPLALPTQGPDWMAAVTFAGAYVDRSRLYRFGDGSKAILPLFSRTGLAGAFRGLSSPPAAWGFGGVLSDRPLTAAHYELVGTDLERSEALQISIRPNPLCPTAWQVMEGRGWISLPRRAHVLRLTEDFETIRAKRFSSNARRHLRTAQAAGLELICGHDPELIGEFHVLLTASFNRWAAQQSEPAFIARLRGRWRDPLMKFMAMSEALGPQMKIFLARLEGRPVAAILVLFGRNAHYTRGAMDKGLAAPTAANYLLHAAAIEEACLRGCATYHMGETGQSKSLADFKEKFGAVGVDYRELRHERLPVSKVDAALRTAVKKMLGMNDG
jgi:hypothetical protein